MPKSNYGGKATSYWIMKQLHTLAPLGRIVDVGPGMGTYSEFRQPGQHWIGVEAWAPYVRKYGLEQKYDQVIVSDVRYFNWQMVAPLDLVIFGDILEHMTKDDALAVLDKALTAARVVIISIPVIHAPQGEHEGNPFEVHVKEDWTNDEALATFSDWCVNVLESYIGVYFLSRRPEDKSRLIAIAEDANVRLQASGAKKGPADDLMIFTKATV